MRLQIALLRNAPLVKLTPRNCGRYVPVSPMCTKSEKVQEPTNSQQEKTKILNEALNFVPIHGWSKHAVAEAAQNLGYSKAITGIFHKPEVEIINYFYEQSRLNLAKELEQLPKVRNHEKYSPQLQSYLQEAIMLRLLMIKPYIGTWSQAKGILALPQNAPDAFHNLSTLIHEIWCQAGCKAVDNSWYRKRLSLGIVYESAELFMLQDKSENFKDTEKYVKNRIGNVSELHHSVKGVETIVENLPKFMANTVSTIQNITGVRIERRS